MPYELYNFVHIVSVILLIGFTFFAFATSSSKSKKMVLTVTGILSLLVFITGFAMAHLRWGMPGWFWVKLVSWLAISAFSGVVYRRRGLAGILMVVTVALVVLAGWAVVYKPF